MRFSCNDENKHPTSPQRHLTPSHHLTSPRLITDGLINWPLQLQPALFVGRRILIGRYLVLDQIKKVLGRKLIVTEATSVGVAWTSVRIWHDPPRSSPLARERSEEVQAEDTQDPTSPTRCLSARSSSGSPDVRASDESATVVPGAEAEDGEKNDTVGRVPTELEASNKLESAPSRSDRWKWPSPATHRKKRIRRRFRGKGHHIVAILRNKFFPKGEQTPLKATRDEDHRGSFENEVSILQLL